MAIEPGGGLPPRSDGEDRLPANRPLHVARRDDDQQASWALTALVVLALLPVVVGLVLAWSGWAAPTPSLISMRAGAWLVLWGALAVLLLLVLLAVTARGPRRRA